MRTLLQIVNQVQIQLALPQATTVVGSSDPQVNQLLALCNEEGRELQQHHDWTQLQTEFNIPIAAPVTTTGTIAASSAVITAIPTTAAITAGTYVVSGTYIPVAARVLSVDSSTQITMTMEATAAATATALVFAKDTYTEPSDFDHFINQTGWDRTNQWQLLGPDSPQIDQWHRSGIVTTGPRRHMRQIGPTTASYRIWPPPSATDTPFQIVFEYISTGWVFTGSAYQAMFTADTDVPVFDDNMLVRGTKWRFLQAKGLEYGPQQKEYLDYVDRRIGMDGGAQKLSLASKRVFPFITPANIQDGYFPGPTDSNMS